MNFDPNENNLKIPLTGRQIIKRPPKSVLTPRHPGAKNPIFSAQTVEEQTETYDIVNPGGTEGNSLLSARSPSLLAFRNKTIQSRPQTALIGNRDKKKKKEAEIISPRNYSTLLTKRPSTALRESSRKVPETISREINTEKLSIAFDEDVIAYFSKRKDGRGHRFIYLNYKGDRSDPFFNPYELVKVPFADVNSEYFTMSANGVTHVMNNGNTEHISLDRWSKESLIFSTIRKLKIFAQFFYWKPFRIWKKFVMRQRYSELSSSIFAHPFFTHSGFFQTQLQIRDIFIDPDNKTTVETMINQYLLSFAREKKYELKEYFENIANNVEHLNKYYSDYIKTITETILALDAKIRDPRILQVKDSDFPEIKRRNPNLAQLMVLEKKKAERRVELTKMVNGQIIALGYFIRDIDYMLLEIIAQSARESWHRAADIIFSDNSAVFQVQVSFSDKGEVIFSPTLQELNDAIHSSLRGSLMTAGKLPRLLTEIKLRPHIRESHPDYKRLIETGPKIEKMIERDDELKEIESKIIEYINESYKKAQIEAQKFTDFYSIYEIGHSWDVRSYIKTRSGKPYELIPGSKNEDVSGIEGGTINFDEEPIVDMRSVRRDIQIFTNDHNRLEGFNLSPYCNAIYINSRTLLNELKPIPMTTLETLRTTLRNMLNDKVDRIKNALANYSKELKIEPKNLQQFVHYCELITETSSLQPTIQEEINFIDDMYRLFSAFTMHIDVTEENQNPLPPQMQLFITAQQVAQTIKDQNMEHFTNNLREITKKLETKLQKYLDMASAQPSSISEAEPERLKTDISQIREKVRKIDPEIKTYLHYQKVLGVKYCDFKGLHEVIDTLNFDERLFDAVSKWQILDAGTMKAPFSTIDIDFFTKSIKDLEGDLSALNTVTRLPTPLLSELTSKLNAIIPYIEQIQLLATANMQTRHWQALFEECGFPNVYHLDIKLEEIVSIGILTYKDKIAKQTSVAIGESQLEEEFKKIQDRWISVQLPILDGQTKSEDSLLLANVEDMITEIEDSVLALIRIESLPFVHGVKDQVSKLKSSLEGAALILDSWQLFQRNWVLLSSLFLHEDTKNALQQQSTRFNWVRRRWVSIVRHASKDLSLLVVCQFPSLLEMMKENNSALEGILTTLGLFVDSKRTSLPRLFVLGNFDVLQLVSFTDFVNLRYIIARLFMKMIDVDTNETNDQNNQSQGPNYSRIRIYGLICTNKESFMFPKNLLISGGIDHWLPSLVDSMKTSFNEHFNTLMIKIKSMQLADWILTTPTHMVYLAFQVLFGRETDECYNQLETNIHSFENYERKLQDKYTEVLALLDTPLTYTEVQKTGLALTLISNFIETIRYLGNDQNSKWWWVQSPKVRYSNDSQKMTMVINEESIDFGWELWGKVRPAILTPSMQRAIHTAGMDKFSMILGSPLTGRKTCIESLAMLSGRYLFYVPAFPDFSDYVISRIVSGTIMMGAWALFTDIDKLPYSAISHLYDQVYSFSDALSAGLTRIIIEGKPVELNPASRIFFTSKSVPNDLLPQFRAKVKPSALSAPERKKIIEIKLVANGFKNSKSVAVKLDSIIPTIALTFKNELFSTSSFAHISSIIQEMGILVREVKDSSFNISFDSDRVAEEYVAARATYLHFSQSLVEESQSMLLLLLFNCFHLFDTLESFKGKIVNPNVFKDEDEINALSAAIKSSMIKTLPAKYIEEQALKLFSLLLSHRVVVIYGSANSGKSSLLSVLSAAMTKLFNDLDASADINARNNFRHIRKMKFEKLFHDSDSWNRNFGTLMSDQSTGSIWAHGKISSTINHLRDNSEDMLKVLVFDGDLSPNFQQFISQVASLDMTKLNSFDYLNFGNNFRFVIETSDIRNLSPSMVPYCGFLSMKHVNDSYESTNTEMILSRFTEISQFEKVEKVFEEVINVTIKYIYHTDNKVCFSESNVSMQDGKILITDRLPSLAAILLRNLIESNEIDPDNNDQVHLAVIYATFQAFSGILSYTEKNSFDAWLKSSFHITMNSDWSDSNVTNHFIECYPKPCLSSHRILKGKLEPQEMKILEQKAVNFQYSNVFISNVIVPTPQYIGLVDLFRCYMRQNQSILLSGEYGKTSFLRFFFSLENDYLPIFIPTSVTKTAESLFNFIDSHTTTTTKFVTNSKKVVFIFEDISRENKEAIEFVRMILTTFSIVLYSPSDPRLYQKAQINDFSVIVTTQDLTELPTRFVSLFAPVSILPMQTETVKYVLTNLLMSFEVAPSMSEKILSFLNSCMLQVQGFPKSLPGLVQIISLICRMKERKVQNENDEETVCRTLISEVNAYVCGSLPKTIEPVVTVYQNIFPNSKGGNYIQGDDTFFYSEFSINSENALVVQAAAHETHFIREELEFYLQVYNNSASEKIVLKFYMPVLKQWALMHRAFTCPGGHSILVGSEGSGRFTLTRFVAHMSEFDFINLSGKRQVDSDNHEYLYAILRDIVTNIALLNKKSILFVRHRGNHVSNDLKIVMDFARNQDFTEFFSKAALDDLYVKFANGQAQKPEQRYALFNQIKNAIHMNFHLSIAVDEGSCFLENKIKAIKIQFKSFTQQDLIDTAAYALSPPMYNNILGTYLQRIPQIIEHLHTLATIDHHFVKLNNYYDFIDNFLQTVSTDYQELFTHSGQLVSSLRFLRDLEEEGQMVDRKIDSITPNLQKLTMDCESLEVSFTSKKEAIATRRKKIEEDLKEKADAVKVVQNEVNQLKTTLDSLIPQLITAQRQIEQLDTNDIETIRINAEEPSAALKLMLEVLCIFLDYPISYDRGGYKLLMDNDCISLLLSKINYQIVSSSVIQQVLPYYNDPHFTSAEMESVAPALQNIYDWISYICKHATTSEKLNKKKVELENLQGQFNEAVEESKLEQQSISQVESQLEEEVKYLDTSMSSKKTTENEFAQYTNKKKNIEAILKDMETLVDKWTTESSSVTTQRETIVGDSLIYAFYVSYCGMFNETDRESLLKSVMDEIKNDGFSASFNNPMLTINDQFMKMNYTDSAFNIEQTYLYDSTLDLYHIKATLRVPLVIDPDMLIEFYFTKSKQYKNIVVASQTSSNLDAILSSAINEGRTLLLFDVDTLHPFVSPLLSLHRLGKSDTLSKEIRIGAKMTTWDPKFKLILFTNHRNVEKIPLELLVRVNVVDVSSSSFLAMRAILNNTFVEFFDPANLAHLNESLRMDMECRVAKEKHEREILESIADVVSTLQTNPNFDFLSDSETMRDILQSKELYFDAVLRYEQFDASRNNFSKITQPYSTVIDILLNVWKAISRYLFNLSTFNTFSYAAFATIVGNALQMPGVGKQGAQMNNEQQQNLGMLITGQILNWIFPSISFRDSVVLMFIIAFLRSESMEKIRMNDLDVIIRHLTEEINSSIDLSSSELGVGDPLEHLKFTNIKNVFTFVQRYISDLFGNDYANTIPIFQVENIISQNASMPTLILSSYKRNPSALIHHYISMKTRGDNFEPISLYDSPEFLKNARKIITTAMSRGTRILLHISKPSYESSSLLSDIYQTMLTTSLHTNFRLIVSCSNEAVETLPHRLLENSRKLRFSDFPSIRHQIMQVYHHHSTSIRSSTNPKAMKKLCYSTALCYSLLRYREMLIPLSYHSYFDIKVSIFKEIFETLRVIIDNTSIVPINVIRDFIQDGCFANSVVDSSDRREIRSLIYAIFGSNFVDDEFTYCQGYPDADKYQMPMEMPLSNYNSFAQKMPVFASADGLLLNRSSTASIRDWIFSRWVTKGIIQLSPAIKKNPSREQLEARLDGYVMSIPQDISTNHLNRLSKSSPTIYVLKQEIINFNRVLSKLRKELANPNLSDDVTLFLNGTVPQKWRDWILFDSSQTSSRFISFMNEKREFLQNCASSALIESVDVRLFSNLRGLLFAYMSEIASKRGLTTDSVSIEFSVIGENQKPPDGFICLTGIHLLCGTYTEAKLVLNRQTKTLQKIPSLLCTVTKSVPRNSATTFMCPLYRTFFVDSLHSRHSINSYVDGQDENLIWYVPLRTDNSQSELIANGTSMLCVLPEQFMV